MASIPKEVERKLLQYKNRKSIKDVFPTVLESDYTDGFIYRYFAKNVLTQFVYEIDEDTYNELFSNSASYPSEIYRVLKLQWKITGPYHDETTASKVIYGVFDTNKRTIDKAKIEMPEISQKLYDLTQFAKIV